MSNAAIFTVALLLGQAPSAGSVDFRRDVAPILERSCAGCHGADKQRSGLRLDRRDDALEGGNSGPVIVPGKAAASRLFRAVAGLDKELRMPPQERPALSAADIDVLRRWIDQGATWPRDTAAAAAATSSHWAFQPVAQRLPPPVKQPGSVRNPIDAFILARLEQEGVLPLPEADAGTLIRRLSFDLTGLPPTPVEVDRFVAASQVNAQAALEELVERLLASPHYGERWGRHWLDLARYADSDGYEQDRPRPYAWRYRQWVIDALNRGMPFDEFTIEQLAGDLLPAATLEQKTATGFHRNTLTNREGGTDKEQFRVEACFDRVATTARAYLGLTMGCAQCHDHKYDPFSQREFYRLFAFFNSDDEVDLTAPLPGEQAKYEKAKLAYDQKKKELQDAIAKQKETLPTAEVKTDKSLLALNKMLTALEKNAPKIASVPTLALGKGRTTHVLIRGDFLRPGVQVTAGTPAVLHPLKSEGKATRLDLAHWLVDPANPLTPRVIANWAWQRFFGRGLVATPEDFGTQGEKPSHPELLDFLARELVQRGWQLKELQRLIVTSATYRQASHHRPELAARDPLNVWLARQNRLRLEAEVLRDNALAVSGLLQHRVGGPSVKPPQPAGISELTYANTTRWDESKGSDRYRRGLYTWFQRTSPYPMLMTFDAPDGVLSCVRREKSNTPLQALTLLNDAVFVECAQALGRRLLAEAAGSEERIELAFRLCLARDGSSEERAELGRLYRELVSLGQGNEAAAWTAVARALMNLDEFVTRE